MTNNEIVEIAKATSEVYTRLTRGLEHITGKNGWMVLFEMELASYVKAKTPDDLLEMEGRVCKDNLAEDEQGKYFKCACGKNHIHRLTFMEYDHPDFEYIILGAECIKTTDDFMAKISGIENFKEKVKKWYKYIKDEERKLTHNACIACGKYDIQKKYKYKKEWRNLWCRDCCIYDRVKCVCCGDYRDFKKDWKGNAMRYCPPCYFSSTPSAVP